MWQWLVAFRLELNMYYFRINLVHAEYTESRFIDTFHCNLQIYGINEPLDNNWNFSLRQLSNLITFHVTEVILMNDSC